MPKIYKYRIYCTSDNKWEYIWNTSPPNSCPVNVAHTINNNSVSELHSVRHIREIYNYKSPYTLTGHNFYRANTTDGNITMNLKSASSASNKERIIIIQKISAVNTVTIDGDGSETIGGSATHILSANLQTIKIQSNGTNWEILDIRTSIGDDKLNGSLYDDTFAKGEVIINNGLDTIAISGSDNTFLKADSSDPSGVIFVSETVLGDSNVAINAGINANKLADGSVSNTEFQYISSLTSNAQIQLNVRVIGPGSSTDNAVARWNTTTGKLLQNCSITIDDSDNMAGLNYIQFNDITPPSNPGDFLGRLYKRTGDDGLFWKPDSGGAELDLTRASTLTVTEVAQLGNIDLITISNAQWAFLGAFNQNLATTNAPTFNGLTSNANIDAGSNKIINLATPTADTDAANKSYVDSVAQGLSIKDSVRITTITSGTLATSFANSSLVDGVTLATGDRILIRNQTNAVENGIYTVQASGAPIRTADMAIGASVASTFAFIEEGTIGGDTGWVCTADSGSDIVGTNTLDFSQFSGAGTVIAGDGLVKSGNTLSAVVDKTTIVIDTNKIKLKNAPTVKGELLTYSKEQTKLSASTKNNYILVADSTQETGLKWGEIPMRLWILQDVKTTGTYGGTATGDNTWRTRDINTVKINSGSDVTLASNEITVTSGTYHIQIKSTFYKTQGSKIRLYNKTDSSTVEYAINVWTSDLYNAAATSEINTYLSITSTKVYEVQYACDRTQPNDGLGIPTGITSISEIYTVMEIKKL